LLYRFTSRWQRVFSASLFGCFFFLEIGAYFDKNGTQPGEIAFTSALLAAIAWAAVRAARAATLLANDDKITVRSFLRTRSWSWDEIDGFVVDTRLVGSRYMQYRRRMLGMRGHDGTVRWFRISLEGAAVSAARGADQASLAAPSDPGCPLVTLANGTLMARDHAPTCG
jgi:hypothetical protein